MWKYFWLIFLILAVVCLIVTILLIAIWDVLGILDELSGRKAKRQIKLLHEMNARVSSTNLVTSSSSITEDVSVVNESNSDLIENTPVSESDENSTNTSDNELPSADIIISSDDVATSYLDNDNVSTSYLDTDSVFNEEYEVATSYLDVSSLNEDNIVKEERLKILEEQSSL